MTWNQIEKLRRELPIRKLRTEEQNRLYEELSCRSMINSCLIYWTRFLESRYKDDYIKELWEMRVKELYDEQLEDFKKATVYHNVYEDWEGCTYNSIKRADD